MSDASLSMQRRRPLAVGDSGSKGKLFPVVAYAIEERGMSHRRRVRQTSNRFELVGQEEPPLTYDEL